MTEAKQNEAVVKLCNVLRELAVVAPEPAVAEVALRYADILEVANTAQLEDLLREFREDLDHYKGSFTDISAGEEYWRTYGTVRECAKQAMNYAVDLRRPDLGFIDTSNRT